MILWLEICQSIVYNIFMRIGISTAAFYGKLETEDAAARVALLGVPCCEVFLETYSEYSGAFGRLVRERLGGTQAVSVHCKTQHFEADLIGQSARQREDALRLLDGLLDGGVALGAETYVFHGPANIRGKAANFSRWQPGIAEAMARCKARGIAFGWETVSWCWLNNPGRIGEFLSLWPELSFVLDVKQVYDLGQEPLSYVEAMGDRLRHIHILDHDANGRYALPGQGIHDFRELAAALRMNGYHGDMILEPYAYMAENDQCLMDAVNWLRDTFHAE